MRGAGERGALRAVVRWAGHPGTLAAVAVLLFNDHVGKRLWPGAVTGKVSDLAWMLVSPVVLALLLTPVLSLVPVLRPRGDGPAIAGLAATGAMFAFAKSGPWGGEVASAVWSWSGVPSRIQGDRSDLVALPALGVSWWLWRRAGAVRRSWRWTAAVAVPLAVVAMVATSEAPRTGPERPVLWSRDGRTLLDTPEKRWITEDGGATWRRTKQSHSDPPRPDRSQPQNGQCVESRPRLCFRLRDVTSPVEASEDGGFSWHTAHDPGKPWHRPSRPIPGPEASPAPEAPSVPEAPLVPEAPSPSLPEASSPSGTPYPSVSPTDGLDPYGAELLVLEGPEGWVVLANYPKFGLLRGTPDGAWAQQEYPVVSTFVAPEPPRRWALGLPVALATGFTGMLAVAASWLLGATAPGERRRELMLLLLRQVLCLFWVRLTAWLCGGELLWKVPGVLPAGVLTVGLLPMLWFLRRGPNPGRRQLLALSAFAVGSAVVALLPYLLWAAHRMPTWSQASGPVFGWALFITLVGAAVGAFTMPPPPVRRFVLGESQGPTGPTGRRS
ncbi:hypothetical protein [Kitasatospora purpeofusca]|uniref:hypothetical protein n=1 Tax=Kitasatospora purpeofusca TaxID=67352 RepID=UPI003649591A